MPALAQILADTRWDWQPQSIHALQMKTWTPAQVLAPPLLSADQPNAQLRLFLSTVGGQGQTGVLLIKLFLRVCI